MSSLSDFDDHDHRAQSAATAFSKGIYQLFVLRNERTTDSYDRVIRMYQCLFQLCSSLLLLNETVSLKPLTKNLNRWLKQRCANPKEPQRNELDPASLITHSGLANSTWTTFPTDHPLAPVAAKSHSLFSQVVEARHHLLYRPFLLDRDGPFWEDCTLIGLIGSVPTCQDIETTYRLFIDAIGDWRHRNPEARIPLEFILTLFREFKVKDGTRPNESILLMYARMLGAKDESIFDLFAYRNELAAKLAEAEYIPLDGKSNLRILIEDRASDMTNN